MTNTQLALHGGAPVRSRPLPVPFDASGRFFGEAELQAIRQVLERGTLTRWGGEKVEALEAAWAQRLGRRHATAVSSGTAALHTALAALHFEPGAEVITSPITDIGTVIAILQNDLIPVFADVCPQTGLITRDTVEACMTSRTRAIMPVHLFGRCRGIREIAALAKAASIYLIEDASQAHFSSLDGVKAGVFGDVGCFSLQQTKVVSCGEGGVVCTDDLALAEAVSLFQNKGWARNAASDREYSVLGLNYRLSELNAAVASAQLEKVDDLIARRAASRDLVAKGLQQIEGVFVAQPEPGEIVSWWALCFQIPELQSELEARFVFDALAAEGVGFLRGYIGASPIYAHHAIRGMATRSPPTLPWSLRSDVKFQYEDLDCPGALAFLRCSFVRLWSERISEADGADIVAAVHKVLSAWREIYR